MKSSRRLYGSKVQFQDTTGPLGRPSRLPFLLELALAAKGLLLGFHARILVAWRQFYAVGKCRFGPSPRVWGEHPHVPAAQHRARTIPTRVGRTLSPIPLDTDLSDHPHACGENATFVKTRVRCAGPSPRVWGERYRCAGVVGRCRTIPTRVGRTLPLCWCCWSMSDHPHACGENFRGAGQGGIASGPSPRVWGEQTEPQRGRSPNRTIPTRVGRTFCDHSSPPESTDYPHACGENVSTAKAVARRIGPSPRVWGEHVEDLKRAIGRRTIPTRVGRT